MHIIGHQFCIELPADAIKLDRGAHPSRRCTTQQCRRLVGITRQAAVPSNAQLHPSTTCQSAARPCLLYDMHDRIIPYDQAWSLQQQQLECMLAEKAQGFDSTDALFIMQHQPVYTLGTGSSQDHLLFDPEASPIPLYRAERGGEVTYHGPGQLVMYPLLDLGAPGCRASKDLHLFMRSLEEVVIRALREVSGLQGKRIEGLTGVWVGQHKLAALGIRAKQWVTYHGLALNVCPDLQPFSDIVPCGISDKAVGSVAQQILAQKQPSASIHDLDSSIRHREAPFVRLDGTSNSSECSDLLLEYRYALLEAFEDVFGLALKAP